MATLNNSGQTRSAMTSQNLSNGKQDLSLTAVRMLTESEIQSLRDSKKAAFEQMMKLP